MQLTRYTDYGLRVLIFLSLQREGQRITISDISKHFAIPRNHLVKVVHRLGMLNYLSTSRGKHGGVRLNTAAEQIRIGDVIRHLETRLDIIDCEAPIPCPIRPECRLKGILQEATDAFLGKLDQYTIADLQQSPGQFTTLLHWQPDKQ